MPALVVYVEHLDGVVSKLGVGPGAAELAVGPANNVHKLFGAQTRLGVKGYESTFAKSLWTRKKNILILATSQSAKLPVEPNSQNF